MVRIRSIGSVAELVRRPELASHGELLISVNEKMPGYPLALSYTTDRSAVHTSVNNEQLLATEVDQFFADLRYSQAESVGQEQGWLAWAEVVYDGVARLLEHRDDLIEQLAVALGDLDAAESRIAELERINESLYLERFRTKSHITKDIVLPIAMVIATIIGPLLAVVADHALDKPVRSALDANDELQRACGNINIGNSTIVVNQLAADPFSH